MEQRRFNDQKSDEDIVIVVVMVFSVRLSLYLLGAAFHSRGNRATPIFSFFFSSSSSLLFFASASSAVAIDCKTGVCV